MKLVNVGIAILLVSAITLGLIEYTTDLKENYNVEGNLNKTLNKTSARLQDYQEQSIELSNTVTNFTLKESALVNTVYVPYQMIKIGWTSMKLIFKGWGTVEAMSEEVITGVQEEGLILPRWLLPTIISVIVLLLVIIVTMAFFKWRLES